MCMVNIEKLGICTTWLSILSYTFITARYLIKILFLMYNIIYTFKNIKHFLIKVTKKLYKNACLYINVKF